MDIVIKNGRVVFAPYTFEDDKDPNTKKAGVRTYSACLGFFLKIFGFAYAVPALGAENKTIYLNRRSLEKWLKRHDIPEYDRSSFYDKVKIENAIKAVVSFAELTKKINSNALDAKTLYDRANLYITYGKYSQALQDLEKAIEAAPNELSYLEERINVIHLEQRRLRSLKPGLKDEQEKQKLEQKINELYDLAIKDCTNIYNANSDWKFSSTSDFFKEKSILLVRAHLFAQTGQNEHAIVDSTVLLAKEPKNPAALLLRSDLYLKAKKFEKAQQDLEALSNDEKYRQVVKEKSQKILEEQEKYKKENDVV